MRLPGGLLALLTFSSAPALAADDAALEARLRSARQELAEKKQVVERFNVTRRALEDATLKLAVNDRDLDGLEQKLRAVEPKGLSYSTTATGAHAVLQGKGGADRLTHVDSELRTSFPMALVRTVELRGAAWRVELDFDPPARPADDAGPAARAPREPIPSSDTKAGPRLGEQIRQTESEADSLAPLLGEVQRSERLLAAYEVRLRQRHEPNRAEQALDAVLPILFPQGLLVSDGTVTFDVGRMTLATRKARPAAELQRAFENHLEILSSRGSPPTLELRPVLPP